jgi:hypothetical protein
MLIHSDNDEYNGLFMVCQYYADGLYRVFGKFKGVADVCQFRVDRKSR